MTVEIWQIFLDEYYLGIVIYNIKNTAKVSGKTFYQIVVTSI